MLLREKYMPRTLDEIIGQPAVETLRELIERPEKCCHMLEGPAGTGKSAAVKAFASQLLATEIERLDFFCGFHLIPSNALTIDFAEELFKRTLRLRPMMPGGNGWKVVLIEELEGCPSKEAGRYLKVALDQDQLPPKTIVFATSNDSSRMEPALRQRFNWICFDSSEHFIEECRSRLTDIWLEETGEMILPGESFVWGECEGKADTLFDGNRWSMRLAMDQMQTCLGNWKRARKNDCVSV